MYTFSLMSWLVFQNISFDSALLPFLPGSPWLFRRDKGPSWTSTISKPFSPCFHWSISKSHTQKKLCMDLTSVTLVFDFFPIISLIQWNSRIKWFYSPRLQKETILSLRNMTTETCHISENILPHCCCLVQPNNHPESFREKRGRSRNVCDA